MGTLREKVAYADDTRWLLKRLVVAMGGEADNKVAHRDLLTKIAALHGVPLPTLISWNPLNRENLYEEWCAEDFIGSSDAAAVATWKGRNGKKLNQTDTARRPTYWKDTSINGLHGLQFSGKWLLTDAEVPSNRDYTIISLVRLNNVTGNQVIIGQNTGDSTKRMWGQAVVNGVVQHVSFNAAGTANIALGTKSLTAGQWQCVVTRRRAAEVDASLNLDGTVKATLPSVRAVSEKIVVGAISNNTNHMNGYVNTIRMYDKDLSDADVLAICEELLSKSTAVAWPTFPANLTPVATDMPMIGVNLSGAEFASKPTNGWPSLANFQLYRSRGIEAIRLPFRMFRIRKDGVFTSELAAMKTCLNNAATAGMKVIMDPHDGFKKEDGTENTVALLLADSLALLAEITPIPSVWMWSLNNEPTTSNRRWWGYAQQLVDGIRAVYPTLRISIAGDSYSSVTRWNTVNGTTPLTGDNTYNYYEGHVYLDENQSGTWGGASSDKLDRNQSVALNRGEAMLTNWVKWLQLNGLKGWIGETGGPPDNASYLAALDAQLTYCAANKIPCYYWSAGNFWPDTDVNALERNGTLKAQFTVLNSHNPTAITA